MCSKVGVGGDGACCGAGYLGVVNKRKRGDWLDFSSTSESWERCRTGVFSEFYRYKSSGKRGKSIKAGFFLADQP